MHMLWSIVNKFLPGDMTKCFDTFDDSPHPSNKTYVIQLLKIMGMKQE